MSAEGYTPTTEELRAHLCSMSDQVGRGASYEGKMFDRWLAQHDREWREGYDEQQRTLEKMHDTLLTLWRSLDPKGRKYMTYQTSADVAREVLTVLHEGAAKAWDEGYQARADEEDSEYVQYGSTFRVSFNNPYRADD